MIKRMVQIKLVIIIFNTRYFSFVNIFKNKSLMLNSLSIRIIFSLGTAKIICPVNNFENSLIDILVSPIPGSIIYTVLFSTFFITTKCSKPLDKFKWAIKGNINFNESRFVSYIPLASNPHFLKAQTIW